MEVATSSWGFCFVLSVVFGYHKIDYPFRSIVPVAEPYVEVVRLELVVPSPTAQAAAHGGVEVQAYPCVELRPWPLRHNSPEPDSMRWCAGGDGQHRGAFVVHYSRWLIVRYCWRHLPVEL